MIETKDLTKFAHHVFSRGRGARERSLLCPEREWFLITVVFLTIFLVGAVSSVWYYRAYQDLPATVSGREAVSVPAYQAAAVARAHEMYRERETRFSELFTTAVNETPAPLPSNSTSTDTSATTTPVSIETATTSVVEPETTTATTGDAVQPAFY